MNNKIFNIIKTDLVTIIHYKENYNLVNTIIKKRKTTLKENKTVHLIKENLINLFIISIISTNLKPKFISKVIHY